MESEKIDADNRQEYEKPRLRIIELAAEEVMAGGCKTQNGTSRGWNGNPCAFRSCVLIGS